MLALKFHLIIDIREYSPTTSSSGKDLFKDDSNYRWTDTTLTSVQNKGKEETNLVPKSFYFTSCQKAICAIWM